MKRRLTELQERLLLASQAFKREGLSYFVQITSEAERKALEIIMLNKKYECVDEDSDESEVLTTAPRAALSQLPTTTIAVPSQQERILV